jgi:hypothetical protein
VVLGQEKAWVCSAYGAKTLAELSAVLGRTAHVESSGQGGGVCLHEGDEGLKDLKYDPFNHEHVRPRKICKKRV